MNLIKLLQHAALQYANQTAVQVGQTPYLTYQALYDKARIIGQQLRQRYDLKTGDRIALAMYNSPEYIELLFASWHAGLAVVPINAKLHTSEFQYILSDAQASVCFASSSLYAQLASHTELPSLKAVIDIDSQTYRELSSGTISTAENISPDQLAWLFYTSGTTGRPKGAALSHRNLMSMTLSYFASVDDIPPSGTLLHAAPMSHGSGLYILPHTYRGAHHYIPCSRGFDEDEIFDAMKHLPHISFFAAPTMIKRLCEHPRAKTIDHRNLHTVIYGGAPMYLDDLLSAQSHFGYKFAQIYGQGESPMTITAMNKATHRTLTENQRHHQLNSVGHPQLAVDVCIMDQNGHRCRHNDVGEIAVNGDAVMTGYWQQAGATEQTLRQGWLYTGDLGYQDSDGYIYLTDRSKDVIISGGSNIYPREVEEILLTHPGIKEASVVGQQDSDWGEVVIAFIVLNDTTLDAEQIDQYCLQHIARFKRPKQYHFLSALPKNNYGKVLKTELRTQLDQ